MCKYVITRKPFFILQTLSKYSLPRQYMIKTCFQRNLERRVSNNEFVCFIARPRSGTSTFFSMFCAEQNATQSVLFVAQGARNAAKAERSITAMQAHGDARATITFSQENKALLSLSVGGQDLIIFDAIDSSCLCRIWMDSIIATREPAIVRKTIVAVAPYFSPKTTTKLPVWIGELENCVHYNVTLLGNQGGRFGSLLLGQTEWTNDITCHRIRVNVLSVEHLCGNDDDEDGAGEQASATTTIAMRVWRRVAAGSDDALRTPNVADELRIDQNMLLHAFVVSNVCYYNRNEPLWVTREQFQNQFVPAYIGEGTQ